MRSTAAPFSSVSRTLTRELCGTAGPLGPAQLDNQIRKRIFRAVTVSPQAVQQRPPAGACTVLFELWFVVLMLQTGKTPVASASCDVVLAVQYSAVKRSVVWLGAVHLRIRQVRTVRQPHAPHAKLAALQRRVPAPIVEISCVHHCNNGFTKERTQRDLLKFSTGLAGDGGVPQSTQPATGRLRRVAYWQCAGQHVRHFLRVTLQAARCGNSTGTAHAYEVHRLRCRRPLPVHRRTTIPHQSKHLVGLHTASVSQ